MAKARSKATKRRSDEATKGPRAQAEQRRGAPPAPAAVGQNAGSNNGDVAWLTVRGAAHNNLKGLDIAFPLGRFTCVTGVSGSGKSSLVNDILYAALARELNRATTLRPGRHDRIEGLEHLDKAIAIDQAPIGRTPRSNPATYIKVFDEIRALFAKLPDARLRGYQPGRFSFNVAARRGGGRCEACEGNGANRIEMDFLADVWVTCPVCQGQRFSRETLQIHYKGRSIADVLELDVQEALAHFENVPRPRGMLQTLHDVGLDYIKLGQSSTTLSGGEAQRIKLARELVKKPTGRTLYILDEPTTGLHFDDIRKLLAVLHGFVDAGNTVVVIEHNLDVIKTADWVIDLGPEGGEEGGWVVAEGTPEEVAACEASYTGVALREVLFEKARRGKAECRIANSELRKAPAATAASGKDAAAADSECAIHNPHFAVPEDAITVVGARQHNLKDITVSFPRNQITVCTGVSGSGKTSFAIDTVFTEGYRRYVESLSAYARQFLGQMAKPRVDHVHGLSPAICIEQKAASKSPRSTVGTITEVYDYMRVLWARVGTPCCPRCQVPIGAQTADEIVDRVVALGPGAPITILAPVSLGDGETYAKLFNRLKSSGYTRVRIDGDVQLTSSATTLDARRKHRVEVVVDRAVVRAQARSRIAESVEHALALGNGVMTLLAEAVETVEEQSHAGTRARRHAGDEAAEAPPPDVAADPRPGRPVAADPRVGRPVAAGPHPGRPVAAGPRAGRGRRSKTRATEDPAAQASSVDPSPRGTRGTEQPAAGPSAGAELRVRHTPARELMFSQRLACTQCGTSYEELGPHHFSFNSHLGWCETCEGLGVQRGAPAAAIIQHPTRPLLGGAIGGWGRVDARSPFGRLLTALCHHLGVEPETPLRDWTAAQRRALMFGTERAASLSPRGAGHTDWLDGSSVFVAPPSARWNVRFQWRGFFPAIDAATRNSWTLRHRLHNVVADIPCITCRGGRLRPDAAAVRLGGNGELRIANSELRNNSPGPTSPAEAPGHADAQFALDSSQAAPAGKSRSAGPPRPAPSLPGKTIVEVCELPLSAAAEFFQHLELDERRRQIAGELLKEIRDRLQFLLDVGLEYLTLNRAAPTLSGGEAQRIRLASQIGSGLSGVLYVLDEPTIGLHPRDNLRLIKALRKLRALGNTLLLIEHDREVIRHADRLLDFGPRAGAEGGQVVAQGTPAEFVAGGPPPTLERAGHPAQSPTLERAGHPQFADATQSPDSEKGAARRGARHSERSRRSERSEESGTTGAVPLDSSLAALRRNEVCAPNLQGSGTDRTVVPSLTRAYLAGTTAIPIPSNRRPVDLEATTRRSDEATKGEGRRAARAAPAGRQCRNHWLTVRGARQNNLANIDVPIPLGRFTCITGVSGSGKSSLVNDILWPALASRLQRAALPPGEHDGIDGVEQLDKVINVDQSPIGNTPSSNPATYTGAFDWIRELFTRLPESKMRGYNANRFSFNRPGGRCEACQGYGQKRIEMHFMPDVWVECETCHGRRYNPETLAVRFKGKSIADVLELRVAEALTLFANVPKVRRMLQTLADVGLDYVQLGQPAPTLSGGEAQRVKLAAELGKPDTGCTFYILDEPTTGLHFDDVRKLLAVIHRLADLGNTVLVVEHNPDVLKSADWLIDLGPEAGAGGGHIVALGTPEELISGEATRRAGRLQDAEWRIANSELRRGPGAITSSKGVAARPVSEFAIHDSSFTSHTAVALKPILEAGSYEERRSYDPAAHAARELQVAQAGFGQVGRETRMPWQVDGRKWHLAQRTSRHDKPRRWEPAALEYVIDLVQKSGPFAATNWNERASVEITAPGAAKWFLHALTGGEWLLELYFRVPPGTFKWRELDAALGLKTLDERDDLPTYGDWARVDVRKRRDGLDAVAVYVHDRAEIDTPAFRRFVKQAARAYLAACAASTGKAAVRMKARPAPRRGGQERSSSKES